MRYSILLLDLAIQPDRQQEHQPPQVQDPYTKQDLVIGVEDRTIAAGSRTGQTHQIDYPAQTEWGIKQHQSRHLQGIGVDEDSNDFSHQGAEDGQEIADDGG